MLSDCEYNTEFYEFEECEDFNVVQSTSKLELEETILEEHLNERIHSQKELNAEHDKLCLAAEAVFEKQEELQQEGEPLWSIDDDTLFYPLGLLNHGTGMGKSVFVTWCEDYLLNFLFKTCKKTHGTKMTKVRLAVPQSMSVVASGDEKMEIDEQNDEQKDDNVEMVIKEILILELNTLLLMRSGHVCYFSSMKSMHPVPWLSGVRCIATATAQGGFSVIRLDEKQNLLYLEMYRDAVNIGRNQPELLKRYDVTFDEENLFNCQWRDERFTLITQPVSEENLAFLQHLTFGVDCELTVKQELHFFTVSGHVFVLIADMYTETTTPDYHIQLLFTHASNVEFIKILCELQMCLIFLQCGTIEIWFVSSITETLERYVHYTGTHYTHYEFSAANNCFYYTDERKVAQLEFSYESEADLVLVEENFKPISDILACTWVESTKRLICLSSNNIFYQISFEVSTPNHNQSTENFESVTQLYELTPLKISQLMEKSQVMKDLTQVPMLLNNAIEQEFSKQQLIAIGQNQSMYKKIIQATLRFSIYPPVDFESETVLLHTNLKYDLQCASLFAVLELAMKKSAALNATNWNLLVDHNGTSHLFSIPATLLLDHKICVLVPLMRKTQDLLPVFKLNLVGFVQHNTEYLAIVLPIQVQIHRSTYSALFSTTRHALNMCSDMSIVELVENFTKANIKNSSCPTPAPTQEPHIVTSKLSAPTHNQHIVTLTLPQQCTFDIAAQVFNAVLSKPTKEAVETIDVDKEQTLLCFHFMQSPVKLFLTDEQTCLCLESTDAGALHYARLHLLLNFLHLNMKVDDGIHLLEELKEIYVIK